MLKKTSWWFQPKTSSKMRYLNFFGDQFPGGKKPWRPHPFTPSMDRGAAACQELLGSCSLKARVTVDQLGTWRLAKMVAKELYMY